LPTRSCRTRRTAPGMHRQIDIEAGVCGRPR
jgi:hypothetical protein